ncbi:MAG: hypothetical protein JO093_01860 [Acidobacteria bacterium]|nr:hypothetical protein [Acidobacteriota bacterium]MBV9184329.1 hypothetical protein [Acidobacteriota bacterium]
MRPIGAAMTLIAIVTFAAAARADDAPPPAVHYPAFRLGAFADVVLSHPTEGGAVEYEGGEIDLYASAQITNDWSAFAETLIQHGGKAENSDLETEARFDLNLERFYAAYNPSDRLRLEIGQIHTGIVQWNEREHRSRFLQTPIDVPSIANRESQGGAWPLHFDGVWASGRVPGALGAAYGVGVGAARGSERDDIQPLFRHGISPAGLFLVSMAPDAVTGFEAGAAGYVGRIRAPGQTMQELDATVYSSFVRGGIELRGEFARMAHTPLGADQEYVTRGWYVLASWRPRGRLKVLRPYFLLDHLHVAPGEQYLSDVHNQNAWSAGVRWDFNRRLALKGDFRTQQLAAPHRESLIRAEVSFSF